MDCAAERGASPTERLAARMREGCAGRSGRTTEGGRAPSGAEPKRRGAQKPPTGSERSERRGGRSVARGGTGEQTAETDGHAAMANSRGREQGTPDKPHRGHRQGRRPSKPHTPECIFIWPACRAPSTGARQDSARQAADRDEVTSEGGRTSGEGLDGRAAG